VPNLRVFAKISELFVTSAEAKFCYLFNREYIVKLSVIMPVYNEHQTLEEIVRQVLDTNLAHEIVIVDDGSTDGSREIMETWRDHPTIRTVMHDRNQGKGSAVRTGFQASTGDILVVQDADLEYDPRDYSKLVTPIVEGRADVVYGSRFIGGPARRVYFWHRVGNMLLTLITNILYNIDLTDMETCYKCMRREVVDGMVLRSRRFDVEPEITAKIAKRGYRIYEVAIAYYGREYEEGKKITGWDALPAIWALIKYRFVD
jgi:glycosyltransferase involved in cell wall biosynthesis